METLRLDPDKMVLSVDNMGYGWDVDASGNFTGSQPMVDGQYVERVEPSDTDGALKFTLEGAAGCIVAGADRVSW